MPLRKSYPIRSTYRGLTDAADATDVFLGASQSLINFLFDRDNPEWIVPRPGVTPLTTFPGFNTPGFVSIFDTIEPIIYGLLATARNPTFDEPFVYNNATQVFNPVANVQATNVPASPATSGAWSPPSLATIGSRVVFTHPGFAGVGGLFLGLIDTSGFTLNTIGTTSLVNPTIITAVGSTVGVAMGQTVTGNNIPAGAWVVGFTANTITLNVACTGAAVGENIIIAGGTPAAPLWAAGNTTTNPLPAAPSFVVNFNNRAYYAVGNTIYWSDNLNPTNIALASQSQVIGDGSPIIGMYGASVQQSSGGVVAALFIFKKGNQIWQFVGDQALNNTALAPLSLNIGTLAARSIVGCDEGVYFAGIDGPKLIDLNGVVMPITHNNEKNASDISVCFRNALTPSRICGAYASQVYRTCMDTVSKGQQLFGQDYWFDQTRRRWNGPHTFAWDCAAPYDNYFIVSTKNTPGVLFKSQAYPDVNSIYTDNGASFNCTALTATMPKNREMVEKQVLETTTELAYLSAPNNNYNVFFLDEQGAVLNQAAIAAYQAGTLWGGFVWGVGLWTTIFSVPHTFDVPWPTPTIFQKLALQHKVQAAQGVAIGTTYMRYQETGYTTTVP